MSDEKQSFKGKLLDEKIKENIEKYKTMNSQTFNVRDYFSNHLQSLKAKKFNETIVINKKSSKNNKYH